MALRGLKVIELAGLAPAPFCGLILSDFGANVIRVDKPNSMDVDTLSRGKRSVIIDLKKPKGNDTFKRLCRNADVLIEPFRAGIMEKLGLGPNELCSSNPRLIYARLTGFGPNGPLSKKAGHDINYIAISGILSLLGRAGDKPYQPLNLIADFAGGGLLCALGICMALLERNQSGKGQVIDANMVEGSSYLGTWVWTTRNAEVVKDIMFGGKTRGQNMLDGGSPYYQTYKTKDDKYVAIGPLEPNFYADLLKGLNLDIDDFPQFENWDETTEIFTKIFATKTQEEWCKVFDSLDACFTPVIPMNEAHLHPHNVSRQNFFQDKNGVFLPKPAPELSRTPGVPSLNKPILGQHTQEVFQEEGFSSKEISSLINEKIIYDLKLKSSL